MGLLFVILGLIVLRGINMDSMKLVLVVAFFWMASPVASHMLARLEAMTDEDLGELEIVHVEHQEAAGEESAEHDEQMKKTSGEVRKEQP